MDAIDANLSRIREALRRYEAVRIGRQQHSSSPAAQVRPSARDESFGKSEFATVSETSTTAPDQRDGARVHPQPGADPASIVTAAAVADSAVAEPIPEPASPSPSWSSGARLIDADMPSQDTLEEARDALEPSEGRRIDEHAKAPGTKLVVIKQSIWSRFKGFLGLR